MIPRFPLRRQRKGHDCGEAVARAVLKHFGRPWPDLAAAGWPSPIDGTDPRVLEALFRAAGLKVLAGEMGLDLLEAVVGEGVPVVCLVRTDGGGFWVGHWVVVTRVYEWSGIHMMDPAEGWRRQPADEFLESWRDVSRSGAVYNQWALAVGE